MQVGLVLAGGVALCAYQCGACAALGEHADLSPTFVAGSSGGAVIGAVICGNPPDQRVPRLRQFWDQAAVEAPWATPWLAAWRPAYSSVAVGLSRSFGRPGVFRPRSPHEVVLDPTGLYDLGPLRQQLEAMVDFERLNAGQPDFSVTATDIESGDDVVFSTRRGERISADHLIASCGLLPEFPPLEIGGRLLGDGGLSANAPVESALADADTTRPLLCFVVDVFAAAVEGRPRTLDQSAGRRWDLLLGNQTRRALRALEREHRLRRELGHNVAPVTLVHLSYRAATHELGLDKMFDFSRAAIEQRWQAGYDDMQEAVRLASLPAEKAHSERAVSVAVWA